MLYAVNSIFKCLQKYKYYIWYNIANGIPKFVFYCASAVHIDKKNAVVSWLHKMLSYQGSNLDNKFFQKMILSLLLQCCHLWIISSRMKNCKVMKILLLEEGKNHQSYNYMLTGLNLFNFAMFAVFKSFLLFQFLC